jgi:hypothetical protein
VLRCALGRKPRVGDRVTVKLAGLRTNEPFQASIKGLGNDEHPTQDLAELSIEPSDKLDLRIPEVEFATPLRHSGKSFSVLGFPPDTRQQGRSSVGRLHAADALGLIQMDSAGQLEVEGGFSGAPVWSPDLGAFIGIVVTEVRERKISWCIPSRIVCRFYNELPVRFRIPPNDRPHIHDYELDDPNVQLFGTISDDGSRRLKAKVTERSEDYRVKLTYSAYGGNPIGKYVTFVTYPDFRQEHEDAYEVFAELADAKATNTIYPTNLFTVAAIGDAGDTALTIDLSSLKVKSS